MTTMAERLRIRAPFTREELTVWLARGYADNDAGPPVPMNALERRLAEELLAHLNAQGAARTDDVQVRATKVTALGGEPLTINRGPTPSSPLPSVGRIVHYGEDSPRAAIVTAVGNGRSAELFIFATVADHLERGRGSGLRADVPFSETPKAGHWSWPPRAGG